jgi:hypothetical protein
MQAIMRKATDKPGQVAKEPRWNEHPGWSHEKMSTRARSTRSGRSGSKSNES